MPARHFRVCWGGIIKFNGTHSFSICFSWLVLHNKSATNIAAYSSRNLQLFIILWPGWVALQPVLLRARHMAVLSWRVRLARKAKVASLTYLATMLAVG
jgi:hypothetical protein